LLNLRTLDEVGWFDERFFIDFVDYDLNMRLLRAGYRIARVNGTYLIHQHGHAHKTWLRTPRKSLDGQWHWETFYSFGHDPSRCYYKARNRVLYSRKHWRSIGFTNEGIAQIPQVVLLTLLFEKGRLSKMRAFVRGFFDGFRLPLSTREAIVHPPELK
jgi:rhamnosyltransferase